MFSACAGAPLFSHPGHWPSWFSGFWTEPGVDTTGPRFSGLATGAEFYHPLSGSPVHRLHTVELLSLHNPMTMQVISYNIYLIFMSMSLYVYIRRDIDIQTYSVGSVSLENLG